MEGVAKRIERILALDRVIRDFGMRLVEAGEGYAKVAVRVEERFLNAHRIGHGVLLFAAADAAFALSVNSITDAVGIHWSLDAMRPALPGEEIFGESRIFHRGRQAMRVDLSVTGNDGRLLAKGQAIAMPRTPGAAGQGTKPNGAPLPPPSPASPP